MASFSLHSIQRAAVDLTDNCDDDFRRATGTWPSDWRSVLVVCIIGGGVSTGG